MTSACPEAGKQNRENKERKKIVPSASAARVTQAARKRAVGVLRGLLRRRVTPIGTRLTRVTMTSQRRNQTCAPLIFSTPYAGECYGNAPLEA